MADYYGPFATTEPEPKGRWIPLAIGAALILVVVAAILIFGRGRQAPANATVDPYSESLQVTGVKMSAAENFIGSSVNYLDGKIANTGGRTVAAARVEAVFRNSMGQVVDRQAQPLMLTVHRPGFPDEYVSLTQQPLTPNANREFHLVFEHISADWDHGYPELRFVHLDLK